MAMAQPDPDEAMKFLNEFGQKKRQSPLSALSGRRAVLVLTGALSVIVLTVTLVSMIFSSSEPTNDLLKLAAEQEDIARWCEQADRNARNLAVLDAAVTLKQVVRSDENTLKTYLKKNLKVKNPDNSVAKLLDKKPDATLTTAAQNNRFDDEFSSLLNDRLVTYRRDLAATKAKSSSKTLKTYLEQTEAKVNNIKFSAPQ